MVERRRFFSFLTNRPPQRHFVSMQLVILTSIMLFVLYGAYALFQYYATSNGQASLTASEFHLRLKDIYQSLAARIMIIFLIGFLVNIFFGLVFLHKVTGPLVRVRQILNEIADGTYPQGMVHFRKADFSKDIAMALSRLIDFLNRMKIKMKPSDDKSDDQ